MDVGQNLKELRLKRGKTLEDVAAYIDTSPQTIYKYENGIIKNIPMKKIKQICRYLEVHPASVMDWGDTENDESLILSISEQLMMEEYRKLSVKGKNTVDMLIHSILEIENSPREEEFEFLKL